VSQYQKGKTNQDFTEGRGSEWQWHQLARMQVCNSLQTDNHASTPMTPSLSFLQARCPFCHPANSVKALKAQTREQILVIVFSREICCRMLKHKSLVQLYGICTQAKPLYIITEYMKYGQFTVG